jgi:hypothetical protein
MFSSWYFCAVRIHRRSGFLFGSFSFEPGVGGVDNFVLFFPC